MDAKYLAEIKARCEADLPDVAAPVFRDRKALLAEVERLTDQHQCDMHNLAAMQTTLNQQAKNCEELIESYKKSNLEQATENYELENENDRLKESMQKNKAAILRPSHIPLATT